MSTRPRVSQDQNGSPPTKSSVPYHPASCQVDTRYSRHLSTPIACWPFWYWSAWGKAYPWWGMWPVKGSSVSRPTSTRSLSDSDGDTTPKLSSRARSQLYYLNPKVWYLTEVFLLVQVTARSRLHHLNPKFGTCQRYIFSDVEPIMAMMDSPSSLFFENFPSHMKHHLSLKQNILFSKARLSIRKLLSKTGIKEDNQIPRNGNASIVYHTTPIT